MKATVRVFVSYHGKWERAIVQTPDGKWKAAPFPISVSGTATHPEFVVLVRR